MVILFESRFAKPIQDGTKSQTIRPIGRRKYLPGKPAKLRRWSGIPFRSTQIEMLSTTIKSVPSIEISLEAGVLTIATDGVELDESKHEEFVRADGFRSVADFIHYFNGFYKFPFVGDLIKW